MTIIKYGQSLVKLLYCNSFVPIKFYCIVIVLIRIQDAFTPLSLRVILIVSACFYTDMNCFGPARVVSTWLWVGSVAADSFGWVVADGFRWFQVVLDGFLWFAVLVATFKNTLFKDHFWTTASESRNNMPKAFKTKFEKDESNNIPITCLYILMASVYIASIHQIT